MKKSPMDHAVTSPNRSEWLVPQEGRGSRELSQADHPAETQQAEDLNRVLGRTYHRFP